ncbi:MAG: hypothetical protein GYB68_17035 [Chloroflexi bacterium]|nr:hypothetical protein [Chloroflexota bacterium]
MAAADSTIRIEGASQMTPGSQQVVKVSLVADSAVEAKEVRFELVWYTEGKGDREEAVVGWKTLHQGNLSAGQSLSDELTITIPASPWSYDGHVVSIAWAMRVIIDTGRRKTSFTYVEPIVVSPYGRPAVPTSP